LHDWLPPRAEGWRKRRLGGGNGAELLGFEVSGKGEPHRKKKIGSGENRGKRNRRETVEKKETLGGKPRKKGKKKKGGQKPTPGPWGGEKKNSSFKQAGRDSGD